MPILANATTIVSAVLAILITLWAIVDCVRNKSLSTTYKIYWLIGIVTFVYLLVGPTAYFCFRVYQELRPYLQKLLLEEE